MLWYEPISIEISRGVISIERCDLERCEGNDWTSTAAVAKEPDSDVDGRSV